MTASSLLSRLAAAYGIQPSYIDVWGKRVEPPAETQAALLRTMGVEVGSEAQIRAALEEVEERQQREFAPSVLVIDADDEVRIPLSIPIDCIDRRLAWSFADENGSAASGDTKGLSAERRRGERAQASLTLPIRPGPGYHEVALEFDGRLEARLRLIVAPHRCLTPADVLGPDRAWGFAAQLYAVRSRRNWGMGDFSDLAQLGELAAREGADFIGVNPLHALFPADARAYSPYRPSSRQLLNALYVDPEAIPELDVCPEARAMIESPEVREALHRARAAPLVDYAAVWALKAPVLERLFAAFQRRPADDPRRAAFETFRRDRGEALHNQALFDALQEHFLRLDPALWSWRSWPEPYRNARSLEVARFAAERADRVAFFEYLQWIADEQFARAQRRACEAGMRVGLFVDLAVGVHPDGATTWAYPDQTPRGASIGAPPDLLNQLGQNWGLAAPSPTALRTNAYAHFADTLRETMRHAGAVRIDHAFGLQRLFWIPDGAPAHAGAYVRYPFDEMMRIVKLESVRNRCLVIGEDLGTLPEGFHDAMERAHVLSYRVLWFERAEDGGFKPPEAWPELALAAATTHDLPTVIGFWLGRDLDWRDRLGLHPSPEAGRSMREERRRDRELLGRVLGLGAEAADVAPAELVTRLYAHIARAPSRLLAAQLEDALEEAEAPNLPGTIDEHPNWRRRLPIDLEELFLDHRVRRLAAALRAVRPRASS